MAFRKLISLTVMSEDESERISQLLNIPQDVATDDESPDIEQKTVAIDQDLFDELPFSCD
jgi:hypothetical protein